MRVHLALLAAAVLGLSACGSDDPGPAGTSTPEGLEVSSSGWATDFSKHSVPLSEFRSGGPPRDGIPPIDEPKFISQAEADEWLGDREPVLVAEAGGETRAYPVQILVWHEIVNDVLGDVPIAVTFCPLCNSSLVFDRRVDGEPLRFGTTGNLRRSDLVMWDDRTESWWQQLTGEAVVGELTGTELEALPSQTLSWADVQANHPDAEVLSRDTGHDRAYGANPYTSYDDPGNEPFLYDGETDARLPAMERVVAFKADGGIVVPFTALRRDPVVEVDVDGTPVVVLFKPGVASALDTRAIAEGRDVGTAGTFDTRVGGRTLTFEPAGKGRFSDRETGSEWDITGRAVSGELKGERLKAVVSDTQFWFALAAFLPDARIATGA